jgi:tRNA pseudouridine55 synthase
VLDQGRRPLSSPAGDETPPIAPEPAWRVALREGTADVIPLLPAGATPPVAAAPSPPQPPRSGILVVDKPPGLTSHDVVRTVRAAAGTRRVGHAGTLDPAATGVLVVCFGSATRVVRDIQAGIKTYTAEIRLGAETDTWDAAGDVVATSEQPVSRQAVEAALAAFRGSITQVPPMYSAVKVGGRRLYELARRGQTVERAPRAVTVHELQLTAWQPPVFGLKMAVSKGFYVRALAHDLGRAVGAGAHLSALRRTAVGRFGLEHAVSLDTLAEGFRDGWWTRFVFALDFALLDLPAMVVGPATVAEMRLGRRFAGAEWPGAAPSEVRVYDAAGVFVGTAVYEPPAALWQPRRVFGDSPAGVT